MNHTYLRYECADTFGLTSSTPSSSSGQTLAVLTDSNANNNNGAALVVSAAASQCAVFDVRSGNPPRPCGKIFHYDDTTNVGTGRALNSTECTCLDVWQGHVATGWVDGAVRIFSSSAKDGYGSSSSSSSASGVVNSLLSSSSEEEDGGAQDPPLVFNGHSNSAITCVCFDKSGGSGSTTNTVSRLASGSVDGSVVVWDVVAETGLFRLKGHNKTVTSLHFCAPKNNHGQQQERSSSSSSLDGLLSTSLDGMLKVWDLDGQCCAQTVTGHRGEVWAADSAIWASMSESSDKDEEEVTRWRIVTGASDNQLRVYAVHAPRRMTLTDDEQDKTIVEKEQSKADKSKSKPSYYNSINEAANDDDAVTYMGSLQRQTNERASLVKFYPPSNMLGVSAHQSKNIEIYSMRTIRESENKRVRRLRRRREKEGKRKNKDEKKKEKMKGMLDDDDDDDDDDEHDVMEETDKTEESNAFLNPDCICASDEIDFIGSVKASHKVRGFVFMSSTGQGNKKSAQMVVSLATNALEVYMLRKKFNKVDGLTTLVSQRVSTMDQYGHPTGIRCVSLSPTDDSLATTISKGMLKVWSVANRSCTRSLPLHYTDASSSDTDGSATAVYALCCAFLPSNTHVVVGTREGHLFMIDVASGDVVCMEERAHGGAVWTLDVTRDGTAMVTGSADTTVKFWEFDDVDNTPTFVHTRTLEMKDDVVAVMFSYSYEKRLVMIATLDCTIKIFFEDQLKFFLNLYGHKLPALAMDCSDDDALLATGGADKTIKLWGLDFGDVHKTLYGHTDSITDIKFVRKTHAFFSCGRDKTVRYWDGDRYDNILVMHGHVAEVNCLAVSKTGAFVLSAGMDRQVRVWERTKDMVFVEEERERELEKMLDMKDGSKGEEALNMKVGNQIHDDDNNDEQTQPQSEAAVRRSVLSVNSGDRIMEAMELADSELQDINTRKDKKKMPNPLLLGMEPHLYMFWVLRTVKSAELEQSLMVLSLHHLERLMYYLIVLLRTGMGVELCAKVAVFLVKTHQNQIIATHTLSIPLRELRRLIKNRVGECRDTVGYNLAALRAMSRHVQERKSRGFYSVTDGEDTNQSVWAGLGLGSDVAAALGGRDKKRVKR